MRCKRISKGPLIQATFFFNLQLLRCKLKSVFNLHQRNFVYAWHCLRWVVDSACNNAFQLATQHRCVALQTEEKCCYYRSFTYTFTSLDWRVIRIWLAYFLLLDYFTETSSLGVLIHYTFLSDNLLLVLLHIQSFPIFKVIQQTRWGVSVR